jgi:hypothetical protein
MTNTGLYGKSCVFVGTALLCCPNEWNEGGLMSSSKYNFRRAYIVGAGATYKAGMPLGAKLLENVVKFSLDDIDKRDLAERVKKNIEIMYSLEPQYPTFEKYLDDIFTLSEKLKGIEILNELSRGIDKKALILLYWYLFHMFRNGGIEKASEYLPEFIWSEVEPSDAIISLNYEWLFENTCCWKLESNSIETLKSNCKLPHTPNALFKGYCKEEGGNIFKPHGSINWFIGKHGIPMTLRFADGKTNTYKLGEKDFPSLFKEEDRGVYLHLPYYDDKELDNKGILIGIAPPQGFKGVIGAAEACLKTGEKDLGFINEYKLLSQLLEKERTRAIEAINSSREIWFIGTLLLNDKHLLSEIYKLSKNKKIVVIDPNRKDAASMADKFNGKVLYYKGRYLEKYSEEIVQNKMQKLDLNSFETLK